VVDRNIVTTGHRHYISGMANKHIGSSMDDFLREEGVLEEFHARAIREVCRYLATAKAKPPAKSAGASASGAQVGFEKR
jgi:hypothetical protein